MTRPPALPHCPAAFRPGGPRQVTAYFEEQVGPVNCVRFRRHARSKDFKGSVMVEFGCDATKDKVRITPNPLRVVWEAERAPAAPRFCAAAFAAARALVFAAPCARRLGPHPAPPSPARLGKTLAELLKG